MKGGGRTSYTRYTKPITESGSNYGGAGGASFDCSTLTFITTLVKIQPGLSKVMVGHLLPIHLESNNVLAVYNYDGDLCGNIVSPKNKRLINCIETGNSFHAKVIDIIGSVLIEIDK